MAGKVFVDEGHSCGSAVNQSVTSYVCVTKGNIAQDKMFSFHSYIGQTRQTEERSEERRRIVARSTANSSAIMRLLA